VIPYHYSEDDAPPVADLGEGGWWPQEVRPPSSVAEDPRPPAQMSGDNTGDRYV
jgi:hypothetical protein